MAIVDSTGLDLLLRALDTRVVRVPQEVYNADEERYSLDEDSRELSELAQGLRLFRRRATGSPPELAARNARWVSNAQQLHDHLARGSLNIDPLTVEELPLREALMETYGIGRGESAVITLALRDRALVAVLTADTKAGRAAIAEGVAVITLVDVLEQWIARDRPTLTAFSNFVDALARAKYQLPDRERNRLANQISLG